LLVGGWVRAARHSPRRRRTRICSRVEGIVREAGEPWVTLPTRNEFAALLAKGGFTVIEDVGAHDIDTRYGIPAVNFERMALARKDS
jgi:O-methyltransferase involved in polyketide biosynthesis